MNRLLLLFLALATGAIASAAPAQGTGKALRIALVADPHIAAAPRTNLALYRARFQQAIAQANASQVALVLIAGDVTGNDKPEDMDLFLKDIKGFQAPVLYVPGNHDVGNKPHSGKEPNDAVSTNRLAEYETRLGPSWYEREVAGVRVIGINSCLLSSGLPAETAQWAFLEKALATPAKLPTILLTHYPLFHKTADEPGGTYWAIEPEPRQRLLALLQRGGVKTVCSGHLHTRAILEQDGIQFIQGPPVSFGLGNCQGKEGWTLLTLDPSQPKARAEFQTFNKKP